MHLVTPASSSKDTPIDSTLRRWEKRANGAYSGGGWVRWGLAWNVFVGKQCGTGSLWHNVERKGGHWREFHVGWRRRIVVEKGKAKGTESGGRNIELKVYSQANL